MPSYVRSAFNRSYGAKMSQPELSVRPVTTAELPVLKRLWLMLRHDMSEFRRASRFVEGRLPGRQREGRALLAPKPPTSRASTELQNAAPSPPSQTPHPMCGSRSRRQMLPRRGNVNRDGTLMREKLDRKPVLYRD